MTIYEIAEVSPGEFAVGRWVKRWFRKTEWHTTCGNFESLEQAKEWIERYDKNLNAPVTRYPRHVCMGHVAANGRFYQLREHGDR